MPLTINTIPKLTLSRARCSRAEYVELNIHSTVFMVLVKNSFYGHLETAMFTKLGKMLHAMLLWFSFT